MRHDLPTVLSLAVTGVLAGCRSLTAIWEHATDLTGADLRSLGVEAGRPCPEKSPGCLRCRHRPRTAGAATVKAVEALAWVDFPAATQVLQVRRTRTTSNHKNTDTNGRAKRTTVEVVYLGVRGVFWTGGVFLPVSRLDGYRVSSEILGGAARRRWCAR